MAVVATKVAQVALTPAQLVSSAQPLQASTFLVTVTIQAADYSTGFLLTNIATACGITNVVAAVCQRCQVAAGTNVVGFGLHDAANNKFRWLVAFTPTDYTATNGDFFTMLITGI